VSDSRFFIVAPNPITRAEVVYSSASEAELPLWQATTCYKKGEQIRTADDRQWEAVYDEVVSKFNFCKPIYNINRDPPTARIPSDTCAYSDDNKLWWKEIAEPSNLMRMFDTDLEAETVAATTLEVHLKPTAKFNAVCLFGLTAAAVTVVCENDLGVNYERTINLAYEDPVFPSVLYKDVAIFDGVPEYDPATSIAAPIKMIFNGVGTNLLYAAGTVKVGVVCIGMKEDVGLACYETVVGITDYSQKTRDVWGEPTIKVDTYSDTVEYHFEAETNLLYGLRDTFAAYRAKPIAYVGTVAKEETCVFGLYQDVTLPIEYFGVSTGVLTVLGVPAAWDKPYDLVCTDDGVLGDGKTVFCSDLPDCEDEEPVADGDYGLCQTKTVTTVCGSQPNILTGMVSDDDGNLLEVGLNGALFYNDKRTAFSPWYTENARCVGYSQYGEVFVIAGDRGLISVMHKDDPRNLWPKEGPNPEYDYIAIAASSVYAYGERMIVLLTRCGARVFSFDGGETWKEVEDLSSTQQNFFDGSIGINYQNEADVSFTDCQSIGFSGNLVCMGRSGGRIHYNTGSNGLWQTARNVPTDEVIQSLAISTAGTPRRVLATTRNACFRTTNFDTWTSLASPFSDEGIGGCYYANGSFYLASLDGLIANLGSCSSSLQVNSVDYAAMGTLAPLQLWDIGFSDF